MLRLSNNNICVSLFDYLYIYLFTYHFSFYCIAGWVWVKLLGKEYITCLCLLPVRPWECLKDACMYLSSPCPWSQEGADAASGPAAVRIPGGQTAPSHRHTHQSKEPENSDRSLAAEQANGVLRFIGTIQTWNQKMWLWRLRLIYDVFWDVTSGIFLYTPRSHTLCRFATW